LDENNKKVVEFDGVVVGRLVKGGGEPYLILIETKHVMRMYHVDPDASKTEETKHKSLVERLARFVTMMNKPPTKTDNMYLELQKSNLERLKSMCGDRIVGAIGTNILSPEVRKFAEEKSWLIVTHDGTRYNVEGNLNKRNREETTSTPSRSRHIRQKYKGRNLVGPCKIW
jgi:hypothetical protein